MVCLVSAATMSYFLKHMLPNQDILMEDICPVASFLGHGLVCTSSRDLFCSNGARLGDTQLVKDTGLDLLAESNFNSFASQLVALEVS
jgi:hypothetical protein